MICYQCVERDRKETPALGVCTRCGRGVCRDHLVWEQPSGYRKVAAGMGFRVVPDQGGAARIVCSYCAEHEGADEG